jgi:hypothetical protein
MAFDVGFPKVSPVRLFGMAAGTLCLTWCSRGWGSKLKVAKKAFPKLDYPLGLFLKSPFNLHIFVDTAAN